MFFFSLFTEYCVIGDDVLMLSAIIIVWLSVRQVLKHNVHPNQGTGKTTAIELYD